jgi:hypothetical protein
MKGLFDDSFQSNKYDEVEENVEKLLINDRGQFR